MAVHQRKSNNKKKASDVKDSTESSSKEKFKSVPEVDKKDSFISQVPWKRALFRVILSILMICVVYWTSKKENFEVFASQKDILDLKSVKVPCSSSYIKDISKFKDCAPKFCGRFVSDHVIDPAEAAHLLRLSKKGLAFGGSFGGASILDLHSGALSYENSFINIYQKLKAMGKKNVFAENDFQVYSNVRNKIQQMVEFNFGIPGNKIFLTHPTFFSEMTAKAAKTVHDEYWHVHVDKETYPSFHYTSLLYLTDYGVDFTGGRFVFVGGDKNSTIEPRIGRISAFTSGQENPHYVEKVNSGKRYALTISFTCDPKLAISDPSIKNFQ